MVKYNIINCYSSNIGNKPNYVSFRLKPSVMLSLSYFHMHIILSHGLWVLSFYCKDVKIYSYCMCNFDTCQFGLYKNNVIMITTG